MSNKKIDELYRQAHQNITQAKAMLEADGEMTDQQAEQVNAWLQQAEEIEKKAKQLEAVLEREASLARDAEAENRERQEKEFKRREDKAGFKSGADFMVSLYNAATKGAIDPRLHALEVKDLAGEQGIYGGYLIPTEQRTQILAAQAEASIVRRRATVIPMGSRIINWPALDHTGGAAGHPAFFGAVRVYWVEENAAIPESQPKFRQVELHARELAAYAEVPNGLLRDSAVSLEAFFSGPRGYGGALAWYEDYDFLRGNGTGKPLGVLNAPAALSTSRNTATNLRWIDVVTMVSKMLMGGAPVWIINQSVMPKVLQLVDGSSNAVFVQNMANAGPNTLLGFPIIWTEKLPVLGTAGDVTLTDWSYYLIGDRQMVTMDVDRSFKFQNNQTAFRLVEAIDGKPWLSGAITLADGSTSVSPFQYLT